MGTVPNPERLPEPERIGDAALRVGDSVWTAGQWEPVTAEPTRDADGVLFVPTLRNGEPRTRTFAAGELVRVHRPPISCPWWCSASACRVGETAQLDASGDLMLSARGVEAHHSSRVDIGREKFDEVLVAAWTTVDGYEPLNASSPSVEVVWTRTVFESIERYTLTARQVRRLVEQLGALLPMLDEVGQVRRREDVEADGCAPWCGGGHAPDYPTCHREVGNVTLATGTSAVVEVHQWEGDEPTVSIYEHTAGETLVTTISPTAAREFGLALLAAADLASGGAR